MNNSKKDRIKKLIFLLTTYFTILLTVKAGTNNTGKNELYPYNTTPTETICPYTTYGNRNIYIADEETIKRIIVESNDIYIIDERDEKDPNMCICNSHLIKSTQEIEDIIDILLQYEKENPSDWERTRDSLINEWIMHNLGFDFGIKRLRTRNVDLNNADEENYDDLILSRILK